MIDVHGLKTTLMTSVHGVHDGRDACDGHDDC
jgi:hypothetical protein